MKSSLQQRVAESVIFSAVAVLTVCGTSWAGPPPPPTIPATPVGNAEISAITVTAVAVYGYWKSRK